MVIDVPYQLWCFRSVRWTRNRFQILYSLSDTIALDVIYVYLGFVVSCYRALRKVFIRHVQKIVPHHESHLRRKSIAGVAPSSSFRS